jgi:hypothetical protein
VGKNYDGYGWIKVPTFIDDTSKSWEERFKALEAHHKVETEFLIAEVRKLAPTYTTPPVETNVRLAQTKLPGGKIIERDWTVHERFQLFAKGFRSGAGVRAIDPACEGLGAYDRGYDEGIQARRDAVDAYAKEIGYTPSILRTQPIAVPDLIAGPNPGQACPDCLLPLAMGCDCATRTD